MTALVALTTADLLRQMSQACDKAGGQSAWAARHGLSRSTVADTLRGQREPSAAIINALGWFPVTRYVPVRKTPGAMPPPPV